MQICVLSCRLLAIKHAEQNHKKKRAQEYGAADIAIARPKD